MTLAQLTQLVNDNIRNAVVKIKKVTHANVEQAIINEIYSPVYREVYFGAGNTQNNSQIIERAATPGNLDTTHHFIYVKKMGNLVWMKGFIKNTDLNPSVGTTFLELEILDPMFYPKELQGQIMGVIPGNNIYIVNGFTNSLLQINAQLNPNEVGYFEFFYPVND
jgi:hypothetical protein